MALCWQRVEESNNQPKLHRLHLVLTDAPKITHDTETIQLTQEEVRLAFCGAMPLTVKKNLSGRFDLLKMDGNPACPWRRSTPFNL